MTSGSPAWEGMSPWEKAAEWQAVSPEIAAQVVGLATRQREASLEEDRKQKAHERELQRLDAEHGRLMDRRRWVLSVVATTGGLVNVLALCAVAWHYADTGNLVPGLTVFGAGTALTASVWAFARVSAPRSGIPRRSTTVDSIPQ